MTCLREYIPNNLANTLKTLNKTETFYLTELLYHRAYAPKAFSLKYKQDCPFPPSYKDKKNLLLFVTTYLGRDLPLIPDKLIEPLKVLLPPPPPLLVKTIQQIPAEYTISEKRRFRGNQNRPIHVYTGEKTAFQEIRRVLSLAQAGKLHISDKEKKPTPGTINAIKNILIGSDFILDSPEGEPSVYTKKCGEVRAYAWPQILLQMDFCHSKKGTLSLTKQGQEFMTSPTAEAYKEGINTLLWNDDYDEMNRINNIHGQTGKAKRFMTEPSERKDAISSALIDWPVNGWITFEEAFRQIFSDNGGFSVIEQEFHLYFSSQNYDHLGGQGIELSKQYARVFLMETLATLKLIDIAYVTPHSLWPEFWGSCGTYELEFCGRYDGLLYVRLNPLGAYCLGAAGQYDAPVIPESKILKILPTHEIIYTESPESHPDIQHFLELIAIRKGDYNWELDKKHILEYLGTGGTTQEIIAFLNDHSKEDFPKNVITFFEDIGSKLGVFGKKEEAILIEVNDPIAAAHIAHSPHTRKYCFLSGENHLTIIAKNIRAFREGVKKLGYVLP